MVSGSGELAGGEDETGLAGLDNGIGSIDAGDPAGSAGESSGRRIRGNKSIAVAGGVNQAADWGMRSTQDDPKSTA